MQAAQSLLSVEKNGCKTQLYSVTRITVFPMSFKNWICFFKGIKNSVEMTNQLSHLTDKRPTIRYNEFNNIKVMNKTPSLLLLISNKEVRQVITKKKYFLNYHIILWQKGLQELKAIRIKEGRMNSYSKTNSEG